MLKKVILILILLGGVVALGYYRSVRQEAARLEQFRLGALKGEHDAVQATQKLDSIQRKASQERLQLVDSLASANRAHKLETDSLTQVISMKEQELKQAQEKRRTAIVKGNGARVHAPESNPDMLRHAQILAYYKKKLEGLPKDLSDYEKRVAVNEVRDEIIKKFSISSAELEKIRQGSNLSD